MLTVGALVSLAVVALVLAVAFLSGRRKSGQEHDAAQVSGASPAPAQGRHVGMLRIILPLAAIVALVGLLMLQMGGTSPETAGPPSRAEPTAEGPESAVDEARRPPAEPAVAARDTGAAEPVPAPPGPSLDAPKASEADDRTRDTVVGAAKSTDVAPPKPRLGTRGVSRPAPAAGDALGPGGAASATGGESARSSGAPPPAAAPAPSEAVTSDKFTVVPVFYGTDRDRREGSKRIEYGAERGRRLEIGRALVSVPASHQVPLVERPWALRIPYFDITVYEEKEDPEKHFTMRELKALSREELLRLVAERLSRSKDFENHALIFVHGFNTSFDNAVYRAAQIVHDLKFDGAPFVYSWPSGGGVASYTYDRESAGQSEPFMRDFLEMVVKDSGAKAVSVIAHSMGNQLLLPVLKDIKTANPGVTIHQVILAAPDVDRDNFENIAREIRGLAKGITLYAASNDRALGVSRRFHGGVPRAGDVPASGPVVLDGVDTIDVTAVSTDSLGINHSGYAENNVLLNDIKLLLQTGTRPPDKRIPILSRIQGTKGEYWKYPAP